MAYFIRCIIWIEDGSILCCFFSRKWKHLDSAMNGRILFIETPSLYPLKETVRRCVCILCSIVWVYVCLWVFNQVCLWVYCIGMHHRMNCFRRILMSVYSMDSIHRMVVCYRPPYTKNSILRNTFRSIQAQMSHEHINSSISWKMETHT